MQTWFCTVLPSKWRRQEEEIVEIWGWEGNLWAQQSCESPDFPKEVVQRHGQLICKKHCFLGFGQSEMSEVLLFWRCFTKANAMSHSPLPPSSSGRNDLLLKSGHPTPHNQVISVSFEIVLCAPGWLLVLRMTLSLWSSCLHLPVLGFQVGTTMSCFCVVLGREPGFHEC